MSSIKIDTRFAMSVRIKLLQSSNKFHKPHKFPRTHNGNSKLNIIFFFRVEIEACINNLRLDHPHPKDRHQSRRTSAAKRPERPTYSKTSSARDKLRYGKLSLENVSEARIETSPNISECPSNLRRCRSLALTNEDVYNSLEISNDGRPNRRAQLIPRVKLHSKTTVREQR